MLISGFSLLFAVTAAFSIYGVVYYRKNGSSPEYSIRGAEHLPTEDQRFPADTNDKLNEPENVQLNRSDEDENRFSHTNVEEPTHPSGPITWNLQRPHNRAAELVSAPVDTSYYGGGHSYESLQPPQSRPAIPYPANTAPYDTHPSNQSQFVGGPEPLAMQTGERPSRHNLALDYDHGGYASGGRVDFPEADYGR